MAEDPKNEDNEKTRKLSKAEMDKIREQMAAKAAGKPSEPDKPA